MIKDRPINFGSYSLFSTIKSLILIGLLLFVLKECHNQKISKEEQVNLNIASRDTIQYYKNKAGEEFAKRMVVETRETNTFLSFQTQDTLLRELQAEVRRNRRILRKKGSSSIIKTETKIDTAGITSIAIDTITHSPIYSSSVSNKWFDIRSVATKDSTSYSLNTFNKLKYTIGIEKTGFLGLGKGKPYAIANDENPYSSIKDMRTYQVTIPDKRFGISGYAGYGATIYKQQVIVGPQFGIGGTYTFIKF